METKATHAWIRLNRGDGVHEKMPVERKGKFVIVADPDDASIRYRLDAKGFDMGENFHRDGWTISRWTPRATQHTLEAVSWHF